MVGAMHMQARPSAGMGHPPSRLITPSTQPHISRKFVDTVCVSVHVVEISARKFRPIRMQNRAIIARESTSVVDSLMIKNCYSSSKNQFFFIAVNS